MITYKVYFELTVADTDAPPSDWIPYTIDQLLERGESFDNFECKEIS